jgi:hypothetical protein
MSKMSNLMVEIQDLYINGYDPEVIALMVEVPISWVHEALSDEPSEADCMAFDDGKEMAKCC